MDNETRKALATILTSKSINKTTIECEVCGSTIKTVVSIGTGETSTLKVSNSECEACKTGVKTEEEEVVVDVPKKQSDGAKKADGSSTNTRVRIRRIRQ